MFDLLTALENTRYINLAYPHRPLITADPDPSVYLPSEDDLWDCAVRTIFSSSLILCFHERLTRSMKV